MNNKKLYVPIVTPMNPDESVNYEALKKLTKKILDDGADGIYAGGSSGECFFLTDEERIKVVDTICKAADGAPVIAHVGAISAYRSILFAKAAEKSGAARVASVPPFYFKYPASCIRDYYYAISDSVKIPTMIYYIPCTTGVYSSADDLAEIINGRKNISSIKFTDTNYYLMSLIKAKTDAEIFSGFDEDYVSALAQGADGAIGTTLNLSVKAFSSISESFDRGDLKTAATEQLKINKLVSETAKTAFLPCVKAILTDQGIECGNCRRPFYQMNNEEKKYIVSAFHKIFD